MPPFSQDNMPRFTYYDITDQQIEGKSYDLGYAFGAAYAINDVFSISAAIRYVDGTYEADGSVTSTPTQTGEFFLSKIPARALIP